MFEDQTQEAILNRMLDKIPRSLDKREGSIIYDSTAPASIEFMLVYAMADWFLKNTFGDTAERYYLVERAKERGLAPKEATHATAKAYYTPVTLDMKLGERFNYEAINWEVIEILGDGYCLVQAEQTGCIGNQPAGRMIPIDYVEGLQSIELVEITIPAEDEEDTEVFRERYLRTFHDTAYGGNIQDYMNKVNEIEGVGGVKVYPVWKGGGTVRIVFMTSEYDVPTAEFVEKVQELIDPVPIQGEGIGIAPIGHTVTVEGVKNSAVTISLHITMKQGISLDSRKATILAIIDEYFLELNKKWESTKVNTVDTYTNTGVTIRISQIESRILDVDGVDDIQHTRLNGEEDNLTLDHDSLAVRGEVIWR